MLKETDYIIYLDYLLKGDKKGCVKTVNRLLNEGVNLKTVYIKLLQKSMYRIGVLWQKGRLSIPAERIATDITLNIINLIAPGCIKGKTGKRILITCVDREHHSIGARIVSDYFEMSGWKPTFLGANVPCSAITALIKKTKPDVVGISSNLYINIARLIKLIEEIKIQNAGQEIIIGGQIFLKGECDAIKKFKNVKYISSMKKLEMYIKQKEKL